MRQGDPAARNDLVATASNRLTRLAKKMVRAEGRVTRWEDSGDIFQNAVVRLCRTLTDVAPSTPREFFRLAALQIRRELIDLARHHFGPRGHGRKHESQGLRGGSESTPPACEPADETLGPAGLAAWGDFHELVGSLPEEEREVFELVWYQGLTHAEAAELLGVATKTIQRRWQSACLKLHENLPDG